MIKAIIAEDEYWVRQMLILSIPWEKLNIEIIAEVDDGQLCVEKVIELQPDLLLLDINLPIMNGMEVLKNTLHRCPGTRTIIITGYSQFEYAQTAVRHGVFDYILKPVVTDQFMQTLHRFKSHWLAEQKHDLEMDRLKNAALLTDWYGRIINESDAIELLKSNRCAWSKLPDKLHGVLLYLHEQSEAEPLGRPQKLELLRRKCEPFVAEWIFDLDARVYCGVLPAFENKEAEIEALWPLVLDLENTENTSVFLSISSTAGAGDDLLRLLDEARYGLDIFFWSKAERIHWSSSALEPFERKQEHPFVFNKDRLEVGLQTGDDRLIQAELDDFFQQLLACQTELSPEEAKLLTLQLLTGVYAYWVQQDFSLERIASCQSIQELRNLVLQLLLAAAEVKMTSPVNDTALAVRQYVDTNYAEPDLSVELIGHVLNFNPSYLSSCFKKQYQIGINRYINELRLTKAVELLQSKSFVIEDLAHQVGFNDSHYFSKCFKKQFGVSFHQYKRVVWN